MSGNLLNRVFLTRLAATAVFDPNGNLVGKVRDLVAPRNFVRGALSDLAKEVIAELRSDTQSDTD
ncbi:MAG: hypothetical protein O3A27_01485 [Actinomycetota bacterium]|nr:hypothetical protein [Actinomycetota bacterium]